MSERQRLEALRQELLWRRCAADARGFFREVVKIRHPSKGMIPFELRDAQAETLDSFLNHNRTVILKARQIGFSTLVAAYVLWLCMFHPDTLVIMLSRTERDATDLLEKAKVAYDHLPEWMRVRMPNLREHQQIMEFPNGSRIESFPSRQNPARGRSASLVVVDEWAFLENQEEAWSSIEPIADIGGKIIGLSTANGWGNFFHTLWVKARTGASSFKPIFFPYSAVPERGELWYEAKREEMLPWQLAQEYPRSEDEAFIKSGNPVFDVDYLAALPTAPPRRGHLWCPRPDSRWSEFRPEGGPLRLWSPPARGEVYVIGADVAEGLEHGDFSSADVIDVRTGEQVANWHGHIDPDLFGETLGYLGLYYNTALVGIEVNNHGLTTCTSLQRWGYPNIYFRVTLDQRTKTQSKKIGWRTSSTSKPLMIDELARSLRGDLTIHDEHAIAELRTYVRDEKGAMGGSPFDDRVMSLAIANQMRPFAYAPEYQQAVNDEGTFDWWVRVALEADQTRVSGQLGVHNSRRPAAAAAYA